MPTTVSPDTALVRGRVVRFTLLDACGMPIGTPTPAMYVTDGFITAKTTKNVDKGDEIKVRLANGTIGVHEPGQATVVNIDIEINLAKINPSALAMLTGDPLILDYASNVVGFEEKALLPISNQFAMEIWTATSAARCSGGAQSSGYMLYPLVEQAAVMFDDISDKEVTATIQATTAGNPSWGKGPYGSATDGSSVRGPVASAVAVAGVYPPGRLVVAVDPAAHRHFEVTPVPAPAPTPTGPVAITLPTAY